jgi:hypothetical protein
VAPALRRWALGFALVATAALAGLLFAFRALGTEQIGGVVVGDFLPGPQNNPALFSRAVGP